MQNFVRQWTKKNTGQCVRWFEKSTGQFKKPPAFVRFPVLNTSPDRYAVESDEICHSLKDPSMLFLCSERTCNNLLPLFS